MPPRLVITRIKYAAIYLWMFAALVSMSVAYGRKPEGGASSEPSSFTVQIPKGIPESLWRKLIPANNPLTKDKVALGRALYFDKRLSQDGTVSCATCHDPAMAFADSNAFAIGLGGKTGVRNSPTVLNAMFSASQFWDGRAASLEEQIKQPLINPVEMGMASYEAAVARVAASGEYRQKFSHVFGSEGITIDTITKAIAAFERTQLSGNAPFDRFISGDLSAITDAQKRGWNLFRGKAQCIVCHTFASSSPFFTDFKFHNTGIAVGGSRFDSLAGRAAEIVSRSSDKQHALNLLVHTDGFSELGRFLVTKQAKDIGAFKTPSLRDVELTAPYMHNAAEKTLLDVVKFYNRGGEKNAHLDRRMFALKLTDAEMSDIVEFLRALTSDDVLKQVQSLRPQTRQPVQFAGN
jgi:cytochrome c peroxidase